MPVQLQVSRVIDQPIEKVFHSYVHEQVPITARMVAEFESRRAFGVPTRDGPTETSGRTTFESEVDE